jgi:hypothetical protein
MTWPFPKFPLPRITNHGPRVGLCIQLMQRRHLYE